MRYGPARRPAGLLERFPGGRHVHQRRFPRIGRLQWHELLRAGCSGPHDLAFSTATCRVSQRCVRIVSNARILINAINHDTAT